MTNKFHLFLWISLIIFFQFSCKKESGPDAESLDKSTPVFSMDILINGENVKFNEPGYRNKAGNKFSLTKLEFFLSDIKLESEEGGLTRVMNHWYMDGEEPATLRKKATSPLKFGGYRAIHFTFGFRKNDNVSGMYTEPPESNMEWPDFMGGGYHYMKMEGGFVKQDGTSSAYATHLGPAGGQDFSFDVSLPISLFIDEKETAVNLQMEILNWYQEPNLYDFEKISGGIMGNDSIQEALQQNGADAYKIAAE